MADPEVRNAPDRSRYEVFVDGDLAGFADYRVVDDVVLFTHAEVFPRYGGQGVATRMAQESLDDVRRDGTKSIRPLCGFYVDYLRKHPEYADLLAS